jgi:pSer/pThr/pTyr-binding forkhead associated (FHA) protein
MIRLILKLKEAQIQEFALEKDEIHIGRAKENDIVIDNIAVSRKHAQIQKGTMGYVLKDLNSSNGTFLNGVKIDAGDHLLFDGAVIGIAKFEIIVKGPSKAAQPSSKAVTQEDVQGTMIFDAARRKPIPEPQALPEPKSVRWPALSAIKGPNKGVEFKITKEITLLGKGSQSDIPAAGWFVSSPQAKITRRGDRFYISHLGGFLSNTKVNGVGIKGDHILKNKDQVNIGRCCFVFSYASAEHGEKSPSLSQDPV